MYISKYLLWGSAYLVLDVPFRQAEAISTIQKQIEPPSSSTPTAPPTTLRTSDSSPSSISNSDSGEDATVDARSASTGPSELDSTTTRTGVGTSITSALNGPIRASSTPVENDTPERNALPLPPRITPTLGVAGVFLVIAGFAYALIGVKSRWIQVFLSCAFLTSLSVTVLIIYVMSPPIRPAIQGAYLVGVFMTGVTLGAGSLVFKELTEGLGCLLGGYCLSLWLLTLRPGGMLRSTTPKVIFIAAFGLAFYASYFYRRIRPYSLIGATSFAGATAAVLGVDCFSKAGLKEFWLYIWDLNDDLFPLDTNTYPITRGMTIELAVIILICLVGAMSQLKLWTVAKNRRRRKTELHQDHERERNQLEEAIGLRIEQDNEKQLMRWEATYGDRKVGKRSIKAKSGLGSAEESDLRKASLDIKEVEETTSSSDAIEITEPSMQGRKQMTVSTDTSSAIIEPIAGINALTLVDTSQRDCSGTAIRSDSINGVTSNLTNCKSPLLAIGQPVAELPCAPHTTMITIPSAGHNSTAASELKVNRLADDILESPDVDVVPIFVPSRTSSLAATVNGEVDTPCQIRDDRGLENDVSGINCSSQCYAQMHGTDASQCQKLHAKNMGRAYSPNGSLLKDPVVSVADNADSEELERIVKEGIDTKIVRSTLSSNGASFKSNSDMLPTEGEGGLAKLATSEPGQGSSVGATSASNSLTKGAHGRCPGRVSQIIMAHRTNEWAKNISPTNEPEFDDPRKLFESMEEESSAPIVNQYLRQMQTLSASTAASFPPKPFPSLNQPMTDVNQSPWRTSDISDSHCLPLPGTKETATSPDTIHKFIHRENQGNLRAMNLPRSVSATSLTPKVSTQGLRGISTPVFGQRLMTSPIDENAEAEFPPVLPSPHHISSPTAAASTLLGKRDDFFRLKSSQLSTGKTVSSTDALSSQLAFRSASRLSPTDGQWQRSPSQLSNMDDVDLTQPKRSANCLTLSAVDDSDNMPLMQRKRMIQRHSASLLQNSWPSTTHSSNVHVPQRPASAICLERHQSTPTFWQESTRQEPGARIIPRGGTETRRADMLTEKRGVKRSRHMSEVSKVQKDSAFDQTMRRGDMQELHREAMRRMQAIANRHIS